MRDLLDSLNVYSSISDAADGVFDIDGVRVVSFLNAHAVNISYENKVFRNALLDSEFLFRDGSGVKIASKCLGYDSGENLNGSDLIPALLERVIEKQGDVFFFGANEETIQILKTKYIDGSGVKFHFINGFVNESSYIEKVSSMDEERLSLVLIGMGMPKQELLALRIKQAFQGRNIVICNGGAILDRLAGRVSRGPKVFRLLGVEWFYRFLNDPFRLFGRYIVGNPVFIVRIFISYFK